MTMLVVGILIFTFQVVLLIATVHITKETLTEPYLKKINHLDLTILMLEYKLRTEQNKGKQNASQTMGQIPPLEM